MKNEFAKCTNNLVSYLQIRYNQSLKIQKEEFPLIELPLLHIYR